ncbi:MAG: YcxB family protein [Ferruginibacter sp.]|nr:YcxB family protein [Ferruginibacter sp.]
MQLQYAISATDYQAYYTWVMWDAPKNKKRRATYFLRQGLPLLAFLAAFYYTGTFAGFSRFTWLAIFFLAATFGFSFFNVRSKYQRIALEIAEDPANASIFLSNLLTIDNSGIVLKNEQSAHHFSWQAFIRKEETKDHYFLFVSAIQALIVPKRIFTTDVERQQFASLLSKNISLDAEFAASLGS